MVDGLMGHLNFGARPERFSGVRVSIELREVAAGEIDPDTMTLQECIARAHQIDAHLVDLAWH